MAYLPYVRSIDKLFNNDWRNIFYAEPAETWQEKLYSLVDEGWTQFLSFVESRRKQFVNYWPLYATFFTGTFIILVVHKSLRYVKTIKLRKKHNSERQIEVHNRREDSKIISDVADEEFVNLIEESCSTSHSDLDSATTARNNDQSDNRRDSSISSEITIVAEERKEIKNFLRNLIKSIEPGDDGVMSKKILENVEKTEMADLPESTREKMDSENCKQFYILTPWLEPPEVSDNLSQKREKNFSLSVNEENLLNENAFFAIESVKSSKPEVPIMHRKNEEKKSNVQMGNLTLPNCHESSSICCADEILSEISDSGENIVLDGNSSPKDFIKKLILEASSDPDTKNLQHISSVVDNFTGKLPELDLSPISRNLQNIENDAPIDTDESVTRTDSKHRFRSLSYENRTASSAEYLDGRRGGSVSPPSRSKNKQRSTKQSKIPTLSPLAHRAMQHLEETDGAISEAANQIRSALLRKLRQVWEQHPRDVTASSSNRSKNSTLDSSIYQTPEGISRIPLPRRSPRHSNINDLTHSTRCDDLRDRFEDETYQSRRDDHIDMTNELRLSDNVSPVLMHSTPKSSHPSRHIDGRR